MMAICSFTVWRRRCHRFCKVMLVPLPLLKLPVEKMRSSLYSTIVSTDRTKTRFSLWKLDVRRVHPCASLLFKRTIRAQLRQTAIDLPLATADAGTGPPLRQAHLSVAEARRWFESWLKSPSALLLCPLKAWIACARAIASRALTNQVQGRGRVRRLQPRGHPAGGDAGAADYILGGLDPQPRRGRAAFLARHGRVPSILHPLYSTLSLHMTPYTPPSAPSLITP